ncbi:MAG: hypothetical protein WD830_09015 [Chloroflexota bacterium]
MFRRSEPIPATEPDTTGGVVRLDQPHDTCFRCGRPTPLGVSLCDRDNPARIKAPSSTQVHGTVLVGVLGGFIALAIILRLITAGVGPFNAAVSGVATRADGGLDIVVSVANAGSRTSGASCRVSPGGAPDYRDYVFFTEPIPPGETRQFTRSLEPAADGQPLSDSTVVVRCN